MTDTFTIGIKMDTVQTIYITAKYRSDFAKSLAIALRDAMHNWNGTPDGYRARVAHKVIDFADNATISLEYPEGTTHTVHIVDVRDWAVLLLDKNTGDFKTRFSIDDYITKRYKLSFAK